MTGHGDFKAAYLKLSPGEIKNRIKRSRELMNPCRVCPRRCEVDRVNGELGFCKTGLHAKVSSRNIHTGEEPPISGYRGSGTIFFSHCNLRCIFCQNYPISQLGVGEVAGPSELAGMMVYLQKQGAHNINFVTPSHVAPQIVEALPIAIESGLTVPIVYNSSGYDSMETLELLDGIVDIYMPDAKYDDNSVAKRLSGADDYVETNRAALEEMHRQVGVLQTDHEGVAQRGLLIRHLVLPEGYAGTEGVMRFICEKLTPGTYISLMSQYFPANKASGTTDMCRGVSKAEYRAARRAMEKFGIRNGFIQGLP